MFTITGKNLYAWLKVLLLFLLFLKFGILLNTDKGNEKTILNVIVLYKVLDVSVCHYYAF